MTFYVVKREEDQFYCLCTENIWSGWDPVLESAFRCFHKNTRTTYRTISKGIQPFNQFFRSIQSNPACYTIHKIELPTTAFKSFKQNYPELLL